MAPVSPPIAALYPSVKARWVRGAPVESASIVHPGVLHTQDVDRLATDIGDLTDAEDMAPEVFEAHERCRPGGRRRRPGPGAGRRRPRLRRVRPSTAPFRPRLGRPRPRGTGFTNRRTTSRSERRSNEREKAAPLDTSAAVLDSRSKATATSFGSRQTCTTRLAVIKLTASSYRLPTRYRPLGSAHRTRRRWWSNSVSSRDSAARAGTGLRGAWLPGIRLRATPAHPKMPPPALSVVVVVVGNLPVTARMRSRACRYSASALMPSRYEVLRSLVLLVPAS